MTPRRIAAANPERILKIKFLVDGRLIRDFTRDVNITKLLLLDQRLSEGSFPSMSQLQDELELSKSKVYAYMREIRDILECEIGPGPDGKGFGYVGRQLPKLPLLVVLGMAGRLEVGTMVLHALTHHLTLHLTPRGGRDSYHILPSQLVNHDNQMLLLGASLPKPKLLAFRLNRVIVQEVDKLPGNWKRAELDGVVSKGLQECWKTGSFQTVLVA
jgi:hypothetical protein